MDGDRVKVLHVISGLGVGGAERLLVLAARHHDRARYPMSVVSLMSGGEYAREIRDEGVPLFELEQQRGMITPSGFRALLSLIDHEKPDIIQGHMFHSNILTRLVGIFLRGQSRTVNTFHTTWEPWWRRFAYRITSPLFHGAIIFSPIAAGTVAGKASRRRPLRYVPYGIEIGPRMKRDRQALKTLLGKDLRGPIWITVGRLSREKGHVDLIEAFSLLEPVEGGPALLIVGEGEDRTLLENKVLEKGLGNRVHFLGQRTDVAQLLSGSDAFVISSRWESGPLVLLEAMAASLPVVSTRVGIVPEVAVDGETALLVEPGRPELLALAMDQLMRKGDEGGLMGQAGRARLEKHFDIKRTQREMEKFYGELGGIAMTGSGAC